MIEIKSLLSILNMASERRKTVLVVDDSKEVGYFVEFCLNGRPYRVMKAYDGEDGLRRIRAEDPDLVVLDMMILI